MAICVPIIAVGGLIDWLFGDGLSSGSHKEREHLYPPQMKARIREITVDDHPAKQIEVRGPFPFEAYGEKVGFIVSVFDDTDDEFHPVISVVEAFQEPYSLAYDSRVKVGFVPPGTGLDPWAPIGVFIPEIMLGPYGGYRQFLAVVRLVDVHAEVVIVNGSVRQGKDAVYWTGACKFSCSLGERGYIQFHQERRDLQSVVIQLAAAVSVADGYLDSEEIQVIRQKIVQWIEKSESIYDGLSDTQRERSYRAIANHALNEAMAGKIDTDALLNHLRRDGDQKLWYEVLELCFDVMAADGTADSDELSIIHKIGTASKIDTGDIAKLRDRKIVDLEIDNKVKTSIEELLGIDADWDSAKIKRHLRKEHKKWNSRLNTVPEGKARENAQRMLNLISEAYKGYTLSERS